jgi:hypothetical protein
LSRMCQEILQWGWIFFFFTLIFLEGKTL